jgi:hypothetical protein
MYQFARPARPYPSKVNTSIEHKSPHKACTSVCTSRTQRSQAYFTHVDHKIRRHWPPDRRYMWTRISSSSSTSSIQQKTVARVWARVRARVPASPQILPNPRCAALGALTLKFITLSETNSIVLSGSLAAESRLSLTAHTLDTKSIDRVCRKMTSVCHISCDVQSCSNFWWIGSNLWIDTGLPSKFRDVSSFSWIFECSQPLSRHRTSIRISRRI